MQHRLCKDTEHSAGCVEENGQKSQQKRCEKLCYVWFQDTLLRILKGNRIQVLRALLRGFPDQIFLNALYQHTISENPRKNYKLP